MPATPTALLLLLLAATLTTTTPLPLTPRAGAPSYVPITPPCHLTYPRTTPSTTPPQSFRPAASLASAQLYSWDRPLSDEAYTNSTALWTNCAEQCNGLSGCKSALLAYNVPGEARLGGYLPDPACSPLEGGDGGL
ncbi:hypothetical protein GTA08_BOTSDO08653 [Neofusicoccum parvum]|nr:hypothetical protein GTA08_BOTSDO08653 [Neofusicoccum parvum]